MDDKTDEINKLFEDHQKRMNDVFEDCAVADKIEKDIKHFLKLSAFTFAVSLILLYFKDWPMWANTFASILISAVVVSVVSIFGLAKRS